MESVLLEPSIGAINLIRHECDKSVINDDYDTVSTSSTTNSLKSIEPEQKKQKLTTEENPMFPSSIDSLCDSSARNPATTLSYMKPLLELTLLAQPLPNLPTTIYQPVPSPSPSTTATDELSKEMQFTLLKEQHQLKSKELELIKILKLIDVCSIPAFHHYSHSLGVNTTSNHSPIPPTNMIYNDKLLKWIEVLLRQF